MVQELLPAISGVNNITLSMKSWTAYVSSALLGCCFALVGLAMIFAVHIEGSNVVNIAGGVVLALTIAACAYRFRVLRSVVLFCNDQGVWIFAGVLPWNRGVRGVKWRDLEQATFVTGFVSYITGSYTIRLGHRFTRTSEVLVDRMAHGRDATVKINEMLAELARQGKLS